MKNYRKKWINYFKDLGVKEEIYNVYLDYVSKMIQSGLPPIFEFNHLAQLLGRTNKYLASVVNSTTNHYRSFYIPKRSGGKRKIMAPYPALLECQQWINKNILMKVKMHPTAHGFIPEKSIITNATTHLNKKCILKLDLKDFFPRIGIERVIRVFRNMGYPQNVSFYLANLCCCDNKLTQGAATSPSLSNIVGYGLDCRSFGLAKSYDLDYTRYADDITFSGKYIPVHFINIVEKIVNETGFKINNDKTFLIYKKGKRIVTGLSVSGKKLRIPRQYKRRLRQEIHYILTKGYYSHVSKLKIDNPFYLNSIYGKLMFWKQIEPDNSYIEKVEKDLYNLLQNKN